MKKHLKGLIISLAAIVILTVAIVVMLNYNPDRKEKPDEHKNNIQTLYLNGNADKIKVTSDNGTLELTKNGKEWLISGVDSEDINALQLEMFVTEATKYESETVVENPVLAEYGLDNPSVTVEITSGDTVDAITVGSKSALENAYFACINGAVFTIPQSQYNTLLSTKADFTSFRRVEINPDNITGIKIERSGEIIDLYIPELTRMEGTVWYMKEPYEAMASDDFIDANLLEQLGAISLSNLADEFGTERAKLTVTEGDKTYLFRISETDGGSVNIEYNGKLYHESASLFSFIDMPLYSYVNKLVAYKHILDIDEVVLEYDGISHTIARKDSEGKSFTADGKNADTDLTKKIYQAIIGITANAFYNNEALGDTILKITYKGGNDETIEFRAVNEYTAAVVKNGAALFTVGISDIEHVKSSVNEYFTLIK